MRAYGIEVLAERDFVWDSGNCDWAMVLLLTQPQFDEMNSGDNGIVVNRLDEEHYICSDCSANL